MVDGSLPSGGNPRPPKTSTQAAPRAGGEAGCQGGTLRLWHPEALHALSCLKKHIETICRAAKRGGLLQLSRAGLSQGLRSDAAEWMSMRADPPVRRPPGPDLEMGFSKTGPAPGVANMQARQVSAFCKGLCWSFSAESAGYEFPEVCRER